MTINGNPWEDMSYDAQRRADINKDIYWVKEPKGDYGICIEINDENDVEINDIELKDIEVLKGFHKLKGTLQWFLMLRNIEEWQIFKVLCEDLIGVATRAKSEKAMVATMEIRLRRWQNLLKQKRYISLPLEVQMGLYSELECLKNTIAPKMGLNIAIQKWVGPESDKQDFLLDASAIEVKSYRTSKGEKIIISSKEQLTSEKENLYLVTYALTKSNNGKSILTIINDIKVELEEDGNEELIDIFEFKLLDYGYSSLIHKPEHLESFIIDKIKYYEINQNFPRLTSNQIPAEIISVKYQIDMSLCEEWETQEESISI